MVVQGSLKQDAGSREHRFLLTDGKASVPVYHRGIPPDLFGEGRGAVVEGTLGADGTFQASTIMAKHSEEYRPPEGAVPGHEELLRTLRSGSGPGGSAAPR
jgi:cytochrome c-type biogenesis protein CcmE